jgi:hypothetical protein
MSAAATRAAGEFDPEPPWPMPVRGDCEFYHSLDFPDGETVDGNWDIRGRFDDYIGRYPLAGKSVLDVGTASGFLAFSAEQRGARVSALDVRHAAEFVRLPFQDSPYYRDRLAWAEQWQTRQLLPRKRGFWYAWYKYKSAVEVHYLPLERLPLWPRRFDIVIAGAIVEHLADPISAIGTFARLADEAVIIAFTPVHESDDLAMHVLNGWIDPQLDYSWWMLSRGLYRRVFENLGFSVEFKQSSALNVASRHFELPTPQEHIRLTIVARRKR